MSASQNLGGPSSCGRALGPCLDKIVKNAAWRKHSHLVSSCKSVLDKLESLPADSISISISSSHSPLFSLSPSDANLVLNPILLALDSAYPKVVDPALECLFKLFSSGLIRGEIDHTPSSLIILKIIESVCKVCGIGDEAIELSVLRVLLSAVRSPCVLIRGECLVHIVRTCYNVYLGGLNGTNQICAKSVLAQIMLVVFTRMEEDSMDVNVKTVSVGELLQFTDKNLNEGSSIHFCQNFVNEVMAASEGVPDDKLLLHNQPSDELRNVSAGAGDDDDKIAEGDHKSELSNKEANGEADTDVGVGVSGGGEVGGSKIREDGFLLFRNICKLSMKFSSQETPDDQILLRGKILSLELLKVIMDNGGPIWRNNERFLNTIKQFLCLSLIKNTALSVMAIFQLQCSIFMMLLVKFRSGLKEEIGIFFPMLVLRVLENVNQPSFLQKMTVLNFLDKISQDSQIIVDIFINYDCDVDAPNIYERIVNGLLKTALGPPPGSTTTLSSVQDITFRHESVKCLVSIIRSMGAWMDQKLRTGDSYLPKSSESSTSTENHSTLSGEDAGASDYDLHSEVNSEMSDAATLEQRRAYKIELQKGISIFNRKPSKGIEFLINAKKVSGSPEEVATFLKNTTGLNETVIGDYLGERDEFCLRVMHAYVDSFNFKEMDFGEAIRFFLRGFRLPGEAQKIDRIMEKFAERYCKCNPNSFTSADTAYVLAYSVIMLNTDAHNSMVKDKMSKADFIRNNRGIDDGKDLPEEYLGTLYDQIVKNEIKMSADSSVPQSKQANSLNKLLGLDGILNLVTGKQTEEKALGANGLLIRRIQEQFKAKSGKSGSIYHVVTDAAILRFMVEVCWGPMLAAFSVTLDQSDDRLATSQCLQGFQCAVHVTAVMGMQTQRDAFVTSVAKFTYLHCAADMKLKNVDAVKAIISVAIEDGNNLQDAWEHILTCLSRVEHLQLLGEGAPPDASYLTPSNGETDEKALKSMGYPSLKKKGTLQNPAVMAVVRGGSYDSTTVGVNSPGLVTPGQIINLISNLNLLDQIGNFELNHVFANSQRLNSEAIVAFVKALCKVSISELQSPTDPRVFSLTKIVEIAHYNMNRIRLVWSRIWNVLSDFFVSVGLSENLSVAIFVMDSLRQLAMKFLEREELANYNFQNEFLRPFVIVMQKSSSTEIRELIVRCISQMVLSRVSNVKSGWKSVFMVFTVAASDERKNVVLLAFETMEKIVREYFPYITETERTTFTDCVRCLTTFTNSRFNSDVSLDAIAFLRFCALKLADGGLICNVKSRVDDLSIPIVDEVALGVENHSNKDDHVSFWIPLLTGLSKLASDPRSAIRKSALEVLFNILNDHGHLFSRSFWITVFNSVIFPIFSGVSDKKDVKDQDSSTSASPHTERSTWDSETSAVAVQCLVDLFVSFFNVIRCQLQSIVSILTGFVRSPVKGPASTGVAALLRLAGELGSRISEDEWREIFLALKEAAASLLPGFMKVLRIMDDIEMPESPNLYADVDVSSDHGFTNDDLPDDNLQTAAYVISRVKSHIAVQLLIVQVASDLYKANRQFLSAANVRILVDIFTSIASHAHQLNSETNLLKKLQKGCSIAGISDPPMVHFENESYENYLDFLQDLLKDNPSMSEALSIEEQLAAVCEEILQIYLNCTGSEAVQQNKTVMHWNLHLGSAKKEEVAARTSLLLSALRVLNGLERDSFRGHARQFFPLLVDLVRCEHNSGEVQRILSNIFLSCIGPIIM
ncbi:PREDICTED: brefeldin A-inhibited guanine nucleotide-exchange protein 1-like [Populus euphratica]|uniref:Brefeldin A-inhibited guanine nucleotide-exchange protein 1-like n=1 Tax=Populus euphratica TaxID=75702 RepID=A0AAJ6SYD1_POPEU|nr:PREDICTED: brefeldin A-inhibited guanine nucleotide-exchange protein 1-like [Populus euphratica]XP_011000851.1 PREDICTED: brefeldin A-inhibited guanine nucleotide-exchange protein 1-like [Populus euphratica]